MVVDKVLGFIGILFRANKAIIGETARNSQKGRLGFVAKDASENSKKDARLHSERLGYPLYEDYTKEELGGALGYDSVSFLLITDKKAAIAIEEKRKERLNEENATVPFQKE